MNPRREGHSEAAARYAGLLRTDPRNFEALRSLGQIRLQEGRLDEALELFGRALNRNPGAAGLRAARGATLAALGRFREAVEDYHKAVVVDPRNDVLLADMGAAQLAMQDAAAAVASFRRALELNPGCVAAFRGLGDAFEATGKPGEAAAAFRSAIGLAPRSGWLHRRLAECREYRSGDPHLAEMEALLASSTPLVATDQVHLRGALAKAYQDLGQPARSFDHVVEGNRIQRSQFIYDEAKTVGLLQEIERRFDLPLMTAKAGLGHPSQKPIFIIGMPRCGSTLVEQVLASHSLVFGAGEITNFDTAITSLGWGRFGSPEFFEALPSMSRKHFYRLGSGYLSSLDAVPRTAERVTNKLLGNFLYAGLLHLALPNARIVHVSRDPVDTCVSRFSKLIAPGQAYSYDLGELGRYHMAYEALMDHWRAVVPPGVMLELRYEDMVADLEGEARRLIAYCGLPWEDACLDFHKTERVVMTPSKAQVRQPLYSNAVGRWRRHADSLQPLLEALGRA